MTLSNIHLTPQLVQAVRDAIDIVDIASEATRLTKRGRRHTGLCPLHKEKTPSFSVDPVQGLYYCFGCGAGGDAIDLHMRTSGDDFPAAIEALARRYGIPLPTRSEAAGSRRGPDTQAALEAALDYFRAELPRSAEATGYLERRRIPAELIDRFGLGYAPPGWQDLYDALKAQVPVDNLVAAGLIGRAQQSGRPYDRFRHRLIFPIHAPSGRLVGFGGRTLGDDKAKYVNTSETAEFHKGSLLYGLHQAKKAIREQGTALLVEGYFDVLGAVASGVDWVVAGMGTALTAEQVRLLSRFADDVVVGFDGDEAGERAHRRSLPLLLAEGLGVRRARFGDGEDPDSLRLAAGGEAVRRAVDDAGDAVLEEIDRLAPRGAELDPRGRAKAADAVAGLLRPIRDSIVRLGYGRIAAGRLDLPEEMLWRRAKAPPSSRPGPAVEEPSRRRSEVRSLEDQVLASLLFGEGELPPPSDLPDPEVFFDSANRNIFSAFAALYGEAESDPPAAKEVAARVGESGGGVDRLARLLLETSAASKRAELPALLARLRRRRDQQRSRELAREISEAQREDDAVRLDRLLQEKTALSIRLHRGPTNHQD